MTELQRNTPVFEKDKEYAECEMCCGDGWVNNPMCNGDDRNSQLDCPVCDGEGQLEIED